jgi:hypothetical protein
MSCGYCHLPLKEHRIGRNAGGEIYLCPPRGGWLVLDVMSWCSRFVDWLADISA